jgi:hypothetical protein
MDVTFDIRRTPFSRFGSYFAVGYRPDGPLGAGLYLRSVHGQGVVRPDLFRLLWADGEPVQASEVEAGPAQLFLRHREGGHAALCITEPGTVRVRGEGMGLRLEMAPGPGVVVHPAGDARWVFNVRPAYRKYMLQALVGEVAVDAPTAINARKVLVHERIVAHLRPGYRGDVDVALDEFGSAWVPHEHRPFADGVAAVQGEFAGWLAGMPEVAPELVDAMARAAYIDGSCAVAPSGLLTRPTLYMSKGHMCNVWSWDHCFNAMALSYGYPDLAWDQLMVVADQQDAHGAFPDALNDFVKHYNFCKPPVHGWALRLMRERTPDFFTPARLREIYEPFGRWADWWLTHRVAEGQRLPHYLHGNDSGWDNSTLFDAGVPVIAPDLAALLALHCSELADIAYGLGITQDALHWRETANRLVRDLLSRLWNGTRFEALRLYDEEVVTSDSLIYCIPIVLGKRLPKPVRDALVAQLRPFITEHGLATERPDSPHYTADGYWRGPIWAPSTLLIVHGLAEIGEMRLARQIAQAFCAMCARSGFAENFDALTGEGLRDPAYTWTASVFMILAHEYAR